MELARKVELRLHCGGNDSFHILPCRHPLLGWRKRPVGFAKHAVVQYVVGKMRHAWATMAFQHLLCLANCVSKKKDSIRCHSVG